MNIFDVPDGFWRAMCEDADHPMACVTTRNQFIWVNSAFERLVGYSVAELVGKTWMSITDQSDVGGDLASEEAVIAGKINCYTMSKQYIHKRGHRVPIELSVRRFPANPVETLLCFRVESPPARATRPELDEVEKHLMGMIEDMRRKMDREQGGIHYHAGDNIGGDATGRDKISNSDRAIRTMVVALLGITALVSWLFYYVAISHNGGHVQPPHNQVEKQNE